MRNLLRADTPKTIFINSMSDLLHRDLPEAYVCVAVRVMRLARWHTYQVFTKRSERRRNLL